MSGEAEIAEVTHDLFFCNNLISGSNTPETDREDVRVMSMQGIFYAAWYI